MIFWKKIKYVLFLIYFLRSLKKKWDIRFIVFFFWFEWCFWWVGICSVECLMSIKFFVLRDSSLEDYWLWVNIFKVKGCVILSV